MNLVTPDFGLLFWQTVTFLAVLFFLSKYAWKPIMKALKERETSIDSALLSAEEARKEMARLKGDNERLLDEARLEKDKMLKTAQKTAEDIVNQAKDAASVEANKLIANAQQIIQQEKHAALAEIKQQVANLSLEIAEKILRRELKEEGAQKELVEGYIKEAKLN